MWCSTLIIFSGDAEINPVPKSDFGQCFSIYHWNLNAIRAYNYAKISLLFACSLQSQEKYLPQGKEIKQNWTSLQKFDF